MNPRRLIQVDKRALQILKSDYKNSNNDIFFINNISTVSAQAKWKLVQVDMDQSYWVIMRDYGVYRWWWYIRNHEDCTKRPIMEFHFWPEIREMQQDGTLVNMWPMRPLRVNDFLKKRQGYVWYQNDIYLAEHKLVGQLKLGTIGRNKLKCPNMVQWETVEGIREKSMEEGNQQFIYQRSCAIGEVILSVFVLLNLNIVHLY